MVLGVIWCITFASNKMAATVACGSRATERELDLVAAKLQLLTNYTPQPQRLETLSRFVNTLTKSMHGECSMTKGLLAVITTARQALENFRVQNHYLLSATSLLVEEGVTEDVCIFCGVCLCDYLVDKTHPRRDNFWCASRQIIEVGLVAFPECGVRKMTAEQLQIEFTAMIMYAHEAPWANAELRAYLAALQRRAAVLIMEHCEVEDGNQKPTSGKGRSYKKLSDFAAKRVLLSCATARLKSLALCAAAAERRVHDQTSQLNFLESNIRCRTLVVVGASSVVTLAEFIDWMRVTIGEWNGPRLREAVSKHT